MKIKAFNGKVIDFPRLETAQDRIQYIIDNILEDKELALYYNPLSEVSLATLDDEEYRKIEDRWIGIKVVGKPDKQEHIKGFLDCLAGYILNAKDLSQKSNCREFYNLAYKSELNELEQKRLDELKKLVVYTDLTKQSFNNSTILIRNIQYEELIKSRIKELESLSENDYTQQFVIEELNKRLKECESIINEVKDLSDIIKKQEESVLSKYKDLKNKFSNCNDRLQVLRLAKDYTRCKDELEWDKAKIRDLISRYQTITELQQDLSK